MQLKKLEAYGFKSFADKIAIDFDQGITAIVGPNGSGKSNITDAIRWVLGEQNVRNLRGTKAEDIIFTGSASRKALGVAEVSLFFDNDGTLPVDFREVAVTRRLYRSGESEFYINRSRCRLKDIYNLFADTGIGHDGMSIIGQNRIDDILNSKPEERRAFFEETAGITKYRNRKRESVRKLSETEANLVRVQDIIHEIESQLKPLARHAEKTRIYNERQQEYRQYRLAGLVRDDVQESGRSQETEKELRQARDAVTKAETQEKSMVSRKAQLDKEIIDLEQALRSLAEKNEGLRQQMEAASTEMAALQERRDQSDAAKERIRKQREAFRQEIAAAEADMSKLSEQENQQKDDLTQAEALLAGEREKARQLAQRIRLQKRAEQDAQTGREEKQQALAQKKQELAVIDRDIENSSGDRDSRRAMLDEAEARLSKLEAQRQEIQQAVQEHQHRLACCSDELHQASLAADQASKKLAGLRHRCDESEQKIQSMQSKEQFLRRMQQAYEGFGRAPRAVLRSQAPWRAGVAGAVAELIEVPRDYITAVETALGSSLQYIVTDDTDTAKAAIAFLKREHQGRVTFLPLSTITARKAPDLALNRQDGVIGWGSDLVKIQEKYRKIAEYLLSRTLVVDTLDHALALAKRHAYRLRIVTLGGELLNPGGALSGGSSRQKETSFIHRNDEIEQIRDALRQERETHSRLTADCTAAREGLDRAEQRRQAATEELHQENVRRAELRVNLERLNEAYDGQVRVREELIREDAARKESFARIQEKHNRIARTVAEAQRDFDDAVRKADEAAEELEDLEQDAEDLSAYIQKQEVSRAVLEQEALRSREHLLLRSRDKERSEQALRENEKEEKSLLEGLAESSIRLNELQACHDDWRQAYTKGKNEQDHLYAQRMDCLAENRQTDQDAHEAAHARNQAQAKVHQLELIAAKIQMALDEQQEAILSEYGLTPERAMEEAPDMDPTELRDRMKELEKQMKDLGPVNPNAPEEYEEQKKRHDFMAEQAKDLMDAKENLEHIIADMDEAMTRQFREAFHEIQIYFKDIFVRLFGGGKAELKLLDEDDVLNTGIDILVTLPQKKRQNLSALSGGERALTVIALLFAFLKYRPSPFSVLDEIDAPLDEANVVRFGHFLREFAASTQFIVVTHRKGTMEAVDTMYGVTIEDAGVSRILSVRLDEEK